MVVIKAEHKRQILSELTADRKRLDGEETRLVREAQRRKLAEGALGWAIDDPTYELLRATKSFVDIYLIASAHDDLDLWSMETLRFLHLASNPRATETYFIRTIRALRNTVTGRDVN